MIPENHIADPVVQTLAKRASAFVDGHAWCIRVRSCSLAFAVSGVVGVFLVELDPVPTSGADAMVWTVVGDLPPAYLVHAPGDTWQDAVNAYIDEMERWIAAVREGRRLDDVIPVNVEPSIQHAEMLATRLDFLRRNLGNVDPESVASDV